MKRLCLAGVAMMVILLGCGAMAWAGEASVFDSVHDIIVRVFTTGTSPNISAYLEARDTVDGTRFAGNQLVVTEENGSVTTLTAGQDDTFLIHGPSDPLSSSDVSMSFDSQSGLVYVFCTDIGMGLHMMKFRVALAGAPAVNGICGTTLNSCTSGTLHDIADSSTKYLWECLGQNGGTDALSCSLPIPVDGVCGTTINSCAQGTLQDIDDSATSYLWNCLSTTGGKPASCSALKSAGSPDLTITSLNAPNALNSGELFSVNLTVKNQGNAPAGSFKVRGYFSSNAIPGDAGDVLLFEWNVPGLDTGQSVSNSISNLAVTGAIHVTYGLIFVVDADKQVAESNESNNSRTVAVTMAR